MENATRGFKRKTIIQNIEEKISEWIGTIDNEDLRKDIQDNYIVTGGAIV